MAGQNYRDLVVWQEAMDFVVSVYRTTAEFPSSELYGLTSQMRRAAVSVPCNVAEGQGRRTKREFAHFTGIAHGSVRELETQLIIAQRLDFISETAANNHLESLATIGRRLNALRNSLERSA